MIAVQAEQVNLDDVRDRVRALQAQHRALLDEFHRLTYGGYSWSMNTWMGVPVLKHPCDQQILQEIVASVRPALIIETGTAFGGSALYLAHLCDLLGSGSVLTIDLDPAPSLPPHPRITYRRGSSIDPEIVGYATGRAVRCGGPVLVVLDSAHHASHVLEELRAYAPLVTPGSFLVVEDTNVNGHPVLPAFGPGPAEALEAFLAEQTDLVFQADALAERHLITMHPGGWLRRVR